MMQHASQTTRTSVLHFIQNWRKAHGTSGAMKTRPMMTARGVIRLAIVTLLLSPWALIPAGAEANTITLGEIELSGSFTLNPAYNFNQPTAQPFGSFTDLTVIQASGIFTPLMRSGDALVMNIPFVLSPPFAALAESKPLAGQMVWSIGGYTIDTTWTNITGADFVGRNVFGLFDLSGHHFDHALTALGAYGYWDFTAPPYDISNFTHPVTGPITLTITEAFQNNGHGGLKPSSLLLSEETFDNGHAIPEPSSFLLLACGLALLAMWRWKRQNIALSSS